jgi:hypothetical protein
MVPRGDRPLQTWKTFLRNHMEGIASIDLFVVPTIAFQQLYAFLVLGHRRRQLLWFAVTQKPTAEWLARQITEALPWDFPDKEGTGPTGPSTIVFSEMQIVADEFSPRSNLVSAEWKINYLVRLHASERSTAMIICNLQSHHTSALDCNIGAPSPSRWDRCPSGK